MQTELQEMMAQQIQATLETVDTSYRDRVDRMAAALACLTNSSDYIAKHAMDIIDAIDKSIAERESRDV